MSKNKEQRRSELQDTLEQTSDKHVTLAQAAREKEQRRSELYVTLAQAAREIKKMNGRGVHVSTLHRWSIRGCRGIRLRTMCLGSVRHTRMDWVADFFAACTEAADEEALSLPTAPTRSSSMSKAAAEAELAEAGI